MPTYPSGAFISSPCFAFVESELHQRGHSSISNSAGRSIALAETAGAYKKWRGIIHGKYGLLAWDPSNPRSLGINYIDSTSSSSVTTLVGNGYAANNINSYSVGPNGLAFQKLVYEATTTPDPSSGTGSSQVRLTFEMRDRKLQGVGGFFLAADAVISALFETVTGSGTQWPEASSGAVVTKSLSTTDSGSSVATTETWTTDDSYTVVYKLTASNEYTESQFMDDAVELWGLMPAVEVEQDTADSFPSGPASWGIPAASLVAIVGGADPADPDVWYLEPIFDYAANRFNINDHVLEPMPIGSSGSIAVGSIRSYTTRADLSSCYPASGTWSSGAGTGYYDNSGLATGSFSITDLLGGELYASHGDFRVINALTALFVRTSDIADDSTLTTASEIAYYMADDTVKVPENFHSLDISDNKQYKLDYEDAWSSPVIDYPDPTP